MNWRKIKTVNPDEKGFAAIVIAVIIVIVLSLMTVGFARLMREEQKSATDKHLSSQAYYAAEAGVNDAAKAINAGYTEAKTSCDDSDVDPSVLGHDYLDSASNQQVGSTGVGYTCLIINPLPPTLEYSAVNTENPKVVYISGVNKANPEVTVPISKLEIGWQDSGEGSGTFAPSTNPTFPTASNWNYTGILRINLTPLYSGGINRQNLIDKNFAAFLYPNSALPAANPGSISFNDGTGTNGGVISYGNCNTDRSQQPDYPRHCNVVITNLNNANYVLSMRSIYKATKVTIKAVGFDGSDLLIKNAQTLVDSTGSAEGVLRRIQVRIPSKNNYSHPPGTEVTGGICKQLRLEPGDGKRDCAP